MTEHSWYKAISLIERIESLSAAGGNIENCDFDRKIAEQRFNKWRSRPSFNDDIFFSQRLSADGIREDQFLYLLGEPLESLQKRFSSPPEWLIEIGKAFSDTAEGIKYFSDQQQLRGFLNALSPIINPRRKRLRDEIEEMARR